MIPESTGFISVRSLIGLTMPWVLILILSFIKKALETAEQTSKIVTI